VSLPHKGIAPGFGRRYEGEGEAEKEMRVRPSITDDLCGGACDWEGLDSREI